MLTILPLFRKTVVTLCSQLFACPLRMAGGYDASRGAGMGGGGGGSIRSAGGSFAKLELVREEGYFITQQSDLIRKLRGRKITLDEFHTKRLKVLEEYNKLLEKNKEMKW